MTRDPRRYRTYFPRLSLIAPDWAFPSREGYGVDVVFIIVGCGRPRSIQRYDRTPGAILPLALPTADASTIPAAVRADLS